MNITFYDASQEQNDAPASRGSCAQIESYLLRSGRGDPTLRCAARVALAADDPPLPVAIPLLDPRLEPHLDEGQRQRGSRLAMLGIS